MQYSTTVPNDPDTHEDFMPANKLQNSDLSLKDIVEQDVNDNPVMIYMKGVPDLPRCGFSSLAMRVLKEYSTCSVASFYNNMHTFPGLVEA
ncbi:monothiol glutaredoxin-S15, mitochondrial-like [Camellia sinensis]|uniref:monothiol glutaredoxin-S15, mitochondrial-like n=1 Tax=Camellia sinensis TaxID=4442 RepID=UPI001036959B|nr:monothiol glutaredoxin-S15, mitochondrial-like [Camellia sinensis]